MALNPAVYVVFEVVELCGWAAVHVANISVSSSCLDLLLLALDTVCGL